MIATDFITETELDFIDACDAQAYDTLNYSAQNMTDYARALSTSIDTDAYEHLFGSETLKGYFL